MEYETRRDCFAAAALQGLLTNGDSIWHNTERAADDAYAYAYAMLARRAKRPTPAEPSMEHTHET